MFDDPYSLYSGPMAEATASPLQITAADRRGLLSRRLVAIVEPLIDAGEGGEGYADLSVERIIRAAGISRSTFYTYFGDKADLLVAMAGDVVADVLGTGDSWWSLSNDAGRDELREALRPPIEAYRMHRTILGAVVEAAATDPGAREQLNRLAEGAAGALTGHIRDCQKAKSAAPDLDPDRTARWLIWMIERGLYQLVSPAAPAEAQKLLDSLTELIWRTLYAGYR